MSTEAIRGKLDFSDIKIALLAILFFGLLWALYSWINPPKWGVLAVIAVVAVHGLLTLLLGAKNRFGRIVQFILASVIFVELATLTGIAVRIYSYKPQIYAFLNSLPQVGKFGLSVLSGATMFACSVLGAIILGIWLVLTVESLRPYRKVDDGL